MNDNILQDLEFFGNRQVYEKLLKQESNNNLENDIKFYRKRIIQLTKNLIKKETYPPSLKQIFDEYMISIIIYLKSEDKREIVQKEYEHFNAKKVRFVKDISGTIDNNILCKNDSATLNNFVIVKNKNLPNTIPTKKIIELNDPKFKDKGVKKKKILTNTNGV